MLPGFQCLNYFISATVLRLCVCVCVAFNLYPFSFCCFFYCLVKCPEILYALHCFGYIQCVGGYRVKDFKALRLND